MTPTRPALRYFGGKWRLAPWIISHFPAHKVYCEPYGGGASVLLRKKRSYAEIYNDLNNGVVNVFRVLQDVGLAADLEKIIRLTPFSRSEFNLSYEDADDPIEQARRMIIISFMGFGSNSASGNCKTGFRANSNRSGTIPAHDWANYPDNIKRFTDRLRGCVIENRDALKVIQTHDSIETLHYVDPPYPISARGQNGRNGYANDMSDDDHREMSEVLHNIDGMVVLSGYPHPLYDKELFSRWSTIDKKTHADGARSRVERLWLNDAAAKKQKQLKLSL